MKRTNNQPKILGLLGALTVVITAVTAHADTNVIDFEGPLPGGLVPVSFVQGTYVPPQSMVTTQYVALGVIMQGAALINAGLGHAASGTNHIGGFSGQPPHVDYGAGLTFTFVSPSDGMTPASTDYFSLTPDNARDSDNTALFLAYSLDGQLLGSVTYDESVKYPGPSRPTVLSGVGRFHTVVVAPTLHSQLSGGIGFDLLTFTSLLAHPRLAIRCPEDRSHVELSWLALSNQTYQLQYRGDLLPSSWTDLGLPVTGDGTTHTVNDTVTGAARFYRVVSR